jgi:hypothetical protein
MHTKITKVEIVLITFIFNILTNSVFDLKLLFWFKQISPVNSEIPHAMFLFDGLGFHWWKKVGHQETRDWSISVSTERRHRKTLSQ